MLPEVKAECKDAAVYVQEPEIVKPRGTLAGFSTLWGTGRGGWLIGFMDCPENIGDSPWRIQADRLRPMVPEGRVVGYQMRAHDKVDSMRFLFRPFKQGEPILGAVVVMSKEGGQLQMPCQVDTGVQTLSSQWTRAATGSWWHQRQQQQLKWQRNHHTYRA
jgi:hypothetical protein